jgi:outer membrane lipoprotein-sorting protein
MKKTIVMIFSLIVCFNAFSQRVIKNGVVVDYTAQKIVKNIVARVNADSPFSFNFSYNITKNKKVIEKDNGTFLSYNGKYRITSKIFNDYCDGKTLYHFVKKTNEVEVSEIEDENSMFNFTSIINKYSKSYRSKLIRTETVNKVSCNVIDLSPMKSSNVSKVRIYSNKQNNRLVKMIIYVHNGNIYTYSFTSYKAKIKVKSTDFIFSKSQFPKAKIIDLR